MDHRLVIRGRAMARKINPLGEHNIYLSCSVDRFRLSWWDSGKSIVTGNTGDCFAVERFGMVTFGKFNPWYRRELGNDLELSCVAICCADYSLLVAMVGHPAGEIFRGPVQVDVIHQLAR